MRVNGCPCAETPRRALRCSFTGEYKASNPYRMAFLLLILLFLWSLQSFFLQQTDQELNFGVIVRVGLR
mgnify:CR=1 FL=1